MSTTCTTVAARRLNPHEERRIAVRSCTDPRTVRKYLQGGKVASTCAARIAAALQAEALDPGQNFWLTDAPAPFTKTGH
jgi:hypothetical protein